MNDSTGHLPPPGSTDREPSNDDRAAVSHPSVDRTPPPGFVQPRPRDDFTAPQVQARPTDPGAAPSSQPQPATAPRQQPAPTQNHGSERWQAAPPPPRRARRPTWLTTLVAVAFLLVPLGLGGWSLASGRAPKPAGSWPSNPRLKYSLKASGSPQADTAIFIGGTADDLYLADRGDGSTRITRYVGGEAKWQTAVGRQHPRGLKVVDDRVFVSSSQDPENAQLDRLDRETGEAAWTITATGRFDFEVIEGRLFVLKSAAADDLYWSLYEYDIDTGDELNKTTGLRYEFAEEGSSIEDGFIAIDEDANTLGVLDLDFQPVGEPVSIEPSGVEFNSLVWSRYDSGWVYYSDRTGTGGIASAVGLSETGDVRFECETQVGQANEVEVRERSTLVVRGVNEVEVLDIDGSDCTTRWHIDRGERTTLYVRQYPVAVDYRGTTEEVDFEFDEKEISVLDWDTGQPIATGEEYFLFNDVGDWITTEREIIIARRVESGDELWQIAAPTESYQWIDSDVVAVIYQGAETSTIDVYGD